MTSLLIINYYHGIWTEMYTERTEVFQHCEIRTNRVIYRLNIEL